MQSDTNTKETPERLYHFEDAEFVYGDKSADNFDPDEEDWGESVDNAFCPTGQGGGVDPTCGFGDASKPTISYLKGTLQDPSSPEHKEMKQKILDTASECKVNLGRSAGHCAEVSVALWDKLGQPKDLKPYSVWYGEEEHVLLYDKGSGVVVDPTGSQYGHRVFTSKDKAPYKKYHPLNRKELEYAREELKDRLSTNEKVDDSTPWYELLS